MLLRILRLDASQEMLALRHFLLLGGRPGDIRPPGTAGTGVDGPPMPLSVGPVVMAACPGLAGVYTAGRSSHHRPGAY